MEVIITLRIITDTSKVAPYPDDVSSVHSYNNKTKQERERDHPMPGKKRKHN